MIFNSIEFLPFIIFFFIFFLILPWKQNKIFICLLSYFFYSSFNPSYLILLIFSTVVDYFCAKKIFHSNNNKTQWLILSLIANLGVLFFFKYGKFFLENLNNILSIFNLTHNFILPDFILPVGISFYTFQTLSYTIDVYRGKTQPTNFLDFALFVSFFPQLVAGPIIRAKDFLPQLFKRTFLTLKRLNLGAFLIISGLFKKIVIADSIAPMINNIFKNPEIFSSIDHVLAILGFSIQIYCDFSGYSDIAIGLALWMGFRIRKNFNFPYLARSLTEFWKRWHISLSTWIRDYVYIPLGGNRKGEIRHYINLVFVMSLFGLWHGASWMFIFWGAIHGFILVAEKIFIKVIKFYKIKIHSNFIFDTLKVFLTFYIVSFAWIFFRSQNYLQAKTFVASYVDFAEWNINFITNKSLLAYIFFFALFNLLFHINKYFFKLKKLSGYIYSLASAIMLFFILTSWNSNNAFIYFQF